MPALVGRCPGVKALAFAGNGVEVSCRDLWLLRTLTAFVDKGTSLLVPFLVNGR
jgi:hypothetical protein